jgi:hypothetical protein
MMNKEAVTQPSYDDSNYKLELTPDQHYKLFTVLTSYIDIVNIANSTDDEIEELRLTLIDAWKRRFDHLTV